MSQHDFNIANQTFPNFRADLNNALVAAATMSAGSSAPTTPYAYQLWFDTTTGTWKVRNSGNTAWISTITTDLATGNLDVTGTVTADGLTVDGTAQIGSDTAKVKFYSDSTYSGIFNGASLGSNENFYMGAGSLFLYSGGSERMRISSGNVGIGDVSPDAPLAVRRDNPSSGRVATFGSNGTPFTGVAAGLNNTVTISRTLRTVAASTTTSLVNGYGGSIVLITLFGDTGVADIQYTFLVTHGWSSASVLFSNSYGTNTATFTFSASTGNLQVNHNHSGAIKFNVATLVVPAPTLG